MLLDRTVKPDSRIGGQEQCFYCKVVVGGTHTDDCPQSRRTVIVKMEVEFPIQVPLKYNEDDIYFFYNEGSHCSDNEVRYLNKLRKKAEENGEACFCPVTKITYIREADEADHRHFGLKEGEDV